MSGFHLSNTFPKTWEELARVLERLQFGLRDGPHWVGATGEIPFQNSWVNFDAGGTPPSGTARHAYFYKMLNRVYLGGVIKTGATGTAAFTLPPGFRPKRSNFAPAIMVSGGIGQLVIRDTGAVEPNNVGAGTNVSTFTFLDGVDFPVGL